MRGLLLMDPMLCNTSRTPHVYSGFTFDNHSPSHCTVGTPTRAHTQRHVPTVAPLSPLTDLPLGVGETDQAFALASHLSTFSLAEVFAQPSVETGPSRVTQLALSECA